MKKAKELLEEVRILYMIDERLRFFSATYLRSETKLTNDPNVLTACTDGFDILINPEFFSNPSFSKEQRLFILFHETCHIVFEHIGRINGRNPKKWNRACDYVINNMAKDLGLSLIQGVLVDPQYIDMSAEDIYELLEDEEGDDDDLGSCLSQVDPNESVGTEIHDEWIRSTIMQANTYVEASNSSNAYIPSTIRDYIEKQINPKVPWNQILPNIISQIGYDDYCWLTRDRRYDEFYIPSMRSEISHPPHFFIDCSMSVSEEDYRKVIGHVNHSLNVISPEYLDITHFDTNIIETIRLSNRAQLATIQLHAGGGTDIDCVIETIKQRNPKVSIIFSDGFFSFYGDNAIKPKSPVIWIIYGNSGFKAPYGRVVLIEEL